MTREALLLQLRDIQAPPEPAWWLLAPAYLVLAGLLILVLFLGWMLLRRKRADRLVNCATAELLSIKADYLQDQDAERLAIRISRWLKQVALLAFPHDPVQSSRRRSLAQIPRSEHEPGSWAPSGQGQASIQRRLRSVFRCTDLPGKFRF